MQLPEIARRVGTIDRAKIVYIEEYVLQYLQIYGCEDVAADERIGLYGKYEYKEGVNIYIIYAAFTEKDKQEIPEGSFEKIGYLRRKHPSAPTVTHEQLSQNEITLTGERNIGQLSGYYIFYDANEKMKDYLSEYYENKLRQECQLSATHIKEETLQALDGQAELIALSRNVLGQPLSLYSLIRTAAIGIIILFCAIAVTTINAHDKMEDFVQTIVQTSEWSDVRP